MRHGKKGRRCGFSSEMPTCLIENREAILFLKKEEKLLTKLSLPVLKEGI
jgi:hypothetical protein